MNKPKLRSSVSVVSLNNNIVEFFLTNTRQQVRIKINNKKILDLILEMDGELTFDEIVKKYEMDTETKKYFLTLLKYLENKAIIRDVNCELPNDYNQYRRVINFIDDYSTCSEETVEMWNNIRNSHVVIVGLGAVGSWVSSLLVQNGIQNLTLIDNDTVDITNLHRQFGFPESDIGLLKTDVTERRLKEFNEKVKVKKINELLDKELLDKLIDDNVDLIINCADQPNVDTTSLWVGEYCMKNDIPHIIGGGYNLHISLIGQTVIPFESACVKCFEKELNKINEIDVEKLRKLSIKNRKIGSFGPMCSIIASMIAMEAVKVLSKKITPANLNRRGEFNIYDMNIKYHNISKDNECEWCGKNGKYRGKYETNRGNRCKRE